VIAPARRAAYSVVRRVFEDESYADRAFRTLAADLDDRDRALAQRLSYGTVQRVRTLDHAIEAIGRRPVRKLDPPVLAALRLGAYQLGYTDQAPHAVVDDTVELVRRAGVERAVPFSNAVMRRLTERLRGLLGSLPEGPLKHSYPDWVHDTWRRDLGEEASLALMRAQNEPPETVVRLVRGDPPGEPTDVPGAFRVDRVDEQALAEGRVWPQSRGSQLAGLVVGACEGERILDSCAAPGGKASMLAGDVTAVELNPGRARELRDNAVLLGASNVHVVEADATALPPELQEFDRALVDAPCSELGTLRRGPDLRWRLDPGTFAALPALQAALLARAARHVRPGGRLVYATCTFRRAEDEEVALGFERAHTGWTRVPAVEDPSMLTPDGFLRTWPHRHGTDGFFAAAWVRR
jgi:16S rRNA (cytosine967-C5)-methyltransferase